MIIMIIQPLQLQLVFTMHLLYTMPSATAPYTLSHSLSFKLNEHIPYVKSTVFPSDFLTLILESSVKNKHISSYPFFKNIKIKLLEMEL